MAVAGIDAGTGEVRWITGDDWIEYHSPIVTTVGGKLGNNEFVFRRDG